MISAEKKVIVVTGATGYVGGRLVPRLLEEGYCVRALGRSLSKLRARYWSEHPLVDLVAVNMLDEVSLSRCLQGAHAVFYLVHSMNPEQKDFEEVDRALAENMVRASGLAGVERIIYLGGLGDNSGNLSKHLRSRAAVADILRAGSVPLTVFRAAMIIGSGSASFEMLRYLVDRLPIMVTPKWIDTPNEPIAIRNVLGYLTGCLHCTATINQVFDIGSGHVLTYRELMSVYAEEAGVGKRWIFPLPVMSLRLSSLWVHLVTPIPASLAGPLVEGLRNPVICQDARIRKIIPQDLLSPREAICRALERCQDAHMETHWTDAGEIPPVEWMRDGDPHWAGGTLYKDEREQHVLASPEILWEVMAQIGGRHGWFHATWLWILRGWLDRLCGGVGFRMGRRDVKNLGVGDALDFWRVASVCPRDHLCLVAEMRLPGRALLEFRLRDNGDGSSRLYQKASFRPRGLGGILYWYAVMPLHEYVFGGMIQAIAVKAEHVAGHKDK